MRIATWNVNSIPQRLDDIQAWLAERKPDIVCLQEIKCVDEAFPRALFEGLGYNVTVHGQKTFNGVALLSKLPFDEVAPGLIGDAGDVQAAFSKPWCRPKAAWCAWRAFICPMATRRILINIPINSNGWTDLLPFHVNG